MDNMRITYYKAVVTATGLNSDGEAATGGRHIKVKSQLADWKTTVPPLMDGVLKLPTPAVDSLVYVLVADFWNQTEAYLPVDYTFESLANDGTALQIENVGAEIHVDADLVTVGVSSLEFVALADKLATQLSAIESAITGLSTSINVHTHTTAVGASSPAIAPDTTSYTAGDTASTKLKAEG